MPCFRVAYELKGTGTFTIIAKEKDEAELILLDIDLEDLLDDVHAHGIEIRMLEIEEVK